VSRIESPCILVCAIDPKTGFCFGCGRTSAEIANWIRYTAEERREIMDCLCGRLEQVERKPRRMTRRRELAQSRGGMPSRAATFDENTGEG